jgi:hypothetical protein
VTAIRIAPVWVFLDGGRFAAKGGDNARWILLDFLGFSRPNRDFSMGYCGLARTVFRGALPLRGVEIVTTIARGLAFRESRLSMKQV